MHYLVLRTSFTANTPLTSLLEISRITQLTKRHCETNALLPQLSLPDCLLPATTGGLTGACGVPCLTPAGPGQRHLAASKRQGVGWAWVCAAAFTRASAGPGGERGDRVSRRGALRRGRATARGSLRSAGDACEGGAGRVLLRPGRAAGPHSGGGSPGGVSRRARAWWRLPALRLCAGVMVPPAGVRGGFPLLSLLLLLLLCPGGGCLPRRRPAGPPVVLGKSRGAAGGTRRCGRLAPRSVVKLAVSAVAPSRPGGGGRPGAGTASPRVAAGGGGLRRGASSP